MVAPYRDDEESFPRHIPPLTDDESDSEGPDGTLHIRTASESSAQNETTLPVPVWLRESASSFKFKWVPVSVRKAARSVATWVEGPKPPRELKITPYFAKIQQAPVQLLHRYVPSKRGRIALLIALYAAWFLTWSLMLKHHATSGFIKGYGRPRNTWCGASFWNEGNNCGLNGNNCRPFSSSHMAFRCPANCDQTHLLDYRWVGNESYIYSPYVIGGPNPGDADSMPVYRGDSFICQAAIHAGVIPRETGGCGVASLIGTHNSFESSKAHGISSISFPASFPRSYTFQSLATSNKQCPSDSRWPLFVVTCVALVIIGLFTTSPGVFFFSLYFMTMMHVGLVSDPPNKPNFYELLSTLFGKLLPGGFIAYVIYITSAVPLLQGLTAQVEKTVLYLGFLFIGALNNYTFAPIIPLERLTPEDLRQPGAGFALAIIVALIVSIAIGQIHYIRVSGYLPKYLALYATMGASLLILLALPGENLRLHHWLYSLILLPGTGFQTRPGLIYQGLLMGLHINGIARWGFGSIIETPASLGTGNEGHDKDWWGSHGPVVNATVPPDASNLTLTWGVIPREIGIDGVSILINDVERWRGYVDEMWNQEQVTLERGKHDLEEPWFVRLAWMNGGSTGRYSKPAVWETNGTWIPPPESHKVT
ncbi:uncharacterized protein HMPREF1541_10858 [Cyphellophora europaea CBS 101466]|uniref:LCCL domain-containing protein n=1 Tax=Cyphellophora europaea (strain CBS 101466) TaxID=1220924 RepID=W2S7H4_CYPE1|nr:uncharacterized protein HMPREF1541_10858 [Cyphellophora europaea CBS 101466]ETN43993.1 hypothetical protein HMPREF1541_10858 [Cyphellophora europaea CBS 101466]